MENTEETNVFTEEQTFDVMAVPCDKTFVVAPEKSEEFKNLKPDSEIRKQHEEMSQRFRINNLFYDGTVRKKIKSLFKK